MFNDAFSQEYCLIKIEVDYHIESFRIIKTSKDSNYLLDEANRLNEEVKELMRLRDDADLLKSEMVKSFDEKSFKKQKVPNKKPDGSNLKKYKEVIRNNHDARNNAYQKHMNNFILSKVPENLKKFFDPKLSFEGLWKTKFCVEKVKDPYSIEQMIMEKQNQILLNKQ